ncbi:hypothetical protein ZHAS_00009462 [Anopheles sinensis]|uniref:Uncharacterized protein n=1 Tax=Anopheles sinensis TaxID=74873 RepID=A0A084VVA8_ANOSI|nr:hypothetical protein ZHAS_00009462 [Anopheles sinensis]
MRAYRYRKQMGRKKQTSRNHNTQIPKRPLMDVCGKAPGTRFLEPNTEQKHGHVSDPPEGNGGVGK